jgi:predicted pyridoxine 5'-phosphate oxidase superfamily flavin-nucleotide-binding protein
MRDPFHSGERAIQERTGERDIALLNGQMIADRVPAAAKLFLRQQRYCALGGSSADGELWAAFLGGPQGFARTDEDGKALYLQLDDTLGTLSRIPPFAGMREGDPLGVLFVELSTRRRLRVNGRCIRYARSELVITVDQANPLCPKYIQRRQLEEREPALATTDIREGRALGEDLIAWITGADTLFVATAHPDRSADVSHRGGKPGFVRYRDGVLRIPDYPGNSMFNTLGNLALNPRAGLALVDFAANRQLQLTGDVRLDLAGGPADGETGGTGRWWELRPRRWIVSPLNRRFAWDFVDASPFNP